MDAITTLSALAADCLSHAQDVGLSPRSAKLALRRFSVLQTAAHQIAAIDERENATPKVKAPKKEKVAK